jgi:hypothetical protein
MEQREGNDWKNARYHAVTGTDVAKIMGCDDMSKAKLLETKARMIDPLENAGHVTKTYLMLGRHFEETAKAAFANWAFYSMVGCRGFTPGMSANPRHCWITGTPDWILEEVGGQKVVVEFKCHFYPSIDQAKPISSVPEIPLKHWLQVQTYMDNLDLEWTWLWSWTVSRGACAFRIKRDKVFWNDVVIPRLEEFYELMELARKQVGSSTWLKILADLRWKRGEKQVMVDMVSDRLLATTTGPFVYKIWDGFITIKTP